VETGATVVVGLKGALEGWIVEVVVVGASFEAITNAPDAELVVVVVVAVVVVVGEPWANEVCPRGAVAFTAPVAWCPAREGGGERRAVEVAATRAMSASVTASTIHQRELLAASRALSRRMAFVPPGPTTG
jgi:hypothetical protein